MHALIISHFGGGQVYQQVTSTPQGVPILPAKGDTVLIAGWRHIVKHIVWDYKAGTVKVYAEPLR